jgi:hypothetical protein
MFIEPVIPKTGTPFRSEMFGCKGEDQKIALLTERPIKGSSGAINISLLPE